ncbi:MAG: histidine kinase [Bacteroidota bacterium]
MVVSIFMRKHLVKIILLLVVITAIALSLSFLDLQTEIYLALSWIAVIIIAFIYGNRLIWKALDQFLTWARFMSFRFFVQLIVSVVYILAIVNGSYFLLKNLLTSDPPTPEQVELMNLFGVIIAVPVLSISFGLHFLKAWKQSELESEQLQKENARSELLALKNHLDPHFLFNNLNILSALIDKDKELSKEFLTKFAEVYRFLLSNKGDELVDISSELEFLDAYIFLINCRFGDNVTVEKNVNCRPEACYIPPLTLQMLFENGIKHNIVSDEKPLRFELLSTDDDYLIVRNNLQEKMNKGFSHGSGIDNIKKRYAHFSEREVYIKKNERVFEVHVPLVEVEEF